MDLAALAGLLVEDGLAASFAPAEQELPADRVNVAIDADGLPQRLNLQLTQVPAGDREMDGVALYQFFVGLPFFASSAEEVQRLEHLLPELNESSPLPGWSIDRAERFPYFRHVAVVPDGPEAGRALVETAWLVYFSLDNQAEEVLDALR